MLCMGAIWRGAGGTCPPICEKLSIDFDFLDSKWFENGVTSPQYWEKIATADVVLGFQSSLSKK